MKKKTGFGGVFLLTLIVAGVLVAIAYVVKPDLFIQLPFVTSHLASESKATPEAVEKHLESVVDKSQLTDSTILPVTVKPPPVTEVSTTLPADSIENPNSRLEGSLAAVDLSQSKPLVESTEKDWKTVSKIIDEMDAEGAAKILKHMDDVQIRGILASVKKKQGAKILSALDPQQAARIISEATR